MSQTKNNLKMNLILTVLVGLLMFTITACDNIYKDDIKNRNTKIAVFSDPHYFAPELLIEDGPAFREYLAGDRKLLAESDALIREIVSALVKSDAEIVLVTGDLSKDGARASHEKLADYLKIIKDSGKMVYVVPGNHDINNPHALAYNGEFVEQVDMVTPDDFRSIYHEFGYDEAVASDPSSLSYVVEPFQGLRIIAMDSCLYQANIIEEYPRTDGAFSAESRGWIQDQLTEARQQEKLVYGMMHHGLIEHFSVQEEFFGEYVIDDWESIAGQFAESGMKLVFTGHFHAQDIVRMQTEQGFLYDIETGSLVSYPCPYRFIDMISDQKLIISSRRIREIDYDTDGKPFQEYAEDSIREGIEGLVPVLLTGLLIEQGMPPEVAFSTISGIVNMQLLPPLELTVMDLVVDAMVAHYEGDESLNLLYSIIIDQMLAEEDEMAVLLGSALQSIYDDPAPADNTVMINLETGKILLNVKL